MQLLWAGSRALGLNPFQPEARSLSVLQLRLACLMGSEDAGKGARDRRIASDLEARSETALSLINFVYKHFSPNNGDGATP